MSRRFYFTVAVLVTFAIAAWLAMFQNLIYQSIYINANILPPVRHKSVLVIDPSSSPSVSVIVDNTPALAATINYTDAGYSPDTVTIGAGGTVTFKNKSSDPFWPATNPHPVHTEYPAAGCKSSAFDACKPIQPGGSWSFKFDLPGKWGFHDHMNPGEGGAIIVR